LRTGTTKEVCSQAGQPEDEGIGDKAFSTSISQHRDQDSHEEEGEERDGSKDHGEIPIGAGKPPYREDCCDTPDNEREHGKERVEDGDVSGKDTNAENTHSEQSEQQ